MVPHVAVSALLRSIQRVFTGALLVGLVLASIGGLVVVQAGRDEVTRADTAVLMLDGTEGGQAIRLDRAVRLYLGGQISRLVLAGSDPGAAHALLVERGILQDKIADVREPTQLKQLQQTQRLLQEARVTDAMLIGEPVESLRLLKIARDHGLELRSAPAGEDTAISLNAVVDEVGRYLVYCFAGR